MALLRLLVVLVVVTVVLAATASEGMPLNEKDFDNSAIEDEFGVPAQAASGDYERGDKASSAQRLKDAEKTRSRARAAARSPL